MTLTVSDGNCSDVTTLNITVWEMPIPSITGTDETCSGICDGAIDLSVTGTGGYTYSWDNGAGNSQDPNGLCTNTYTVLITDINGCQATASYTINGPNTLIGSLDASIDVTCNGASDGTATVSASGGTSPYTFDIGAGPQASGSFTGLSAGAYTITITDVNNCNTTVSLSINEPTTLTGSVALQNDVTCNGGSDGNSTITATGGTNPYF